MIGSAELEIIGETTTGKRFKYLKMETGQYDNVHIN